MRILIIEDDELIAQALQRGLQADYAVDVVSTAKDALSKTEDTTYDAILLDLHLPDAHGAELCKRLRANKYNGPIIILTGSVAVNDKVAALDVGADDYITKPFSLEEVKARLRAVMRRTVVTDSSKAVHSHNFYLDAAVHSVMRNGEAIALRRKEFDILEYLLRNEGKTLTRSMIMNHIWDNSDAIWANVIDVHIKHLRDKIDRPYGSHLIQTVHGVGYKLDAAQFGGKGE